GAGGGGARRRPPALGVLGELQRCRQLGHFDPAHNRAVAVDDDLRLAGVFGRCGERQRLEGERRLNVSSRRTGARRGERQKRREPRSHHRIVQRYTMRLLTSRVSSGGHSSPMSHMCDTTREPGRNAFNFGISRSLRRGIRKSVTTVAWLKSVSNRSWW